MSVLNYCTQITVKDSDPTGVLAYQYHYFYGSPANPATLFANSTRSLFSPWMDGREFRTVTYDVASGMYTSTALHDKRDTWKQLAYPGWWNNSITLYAPPAGNPRTIETDDVIDDGEVYSRVTGYSSDFFNNVTDVYDYDYGGTLLRHAQTSFQTSSSYTSTPVSLGSLPLQQTVQDGSGNTLSQTQFCYDEPVGSTGSSCASAVAARGNSTRVRHWSSTAGQNLDTIATFDSYGNPISVTDPRGYTTSYAYTPSCSYGFLNTITNADSQIRLLDLSQVIALAIPSSLCATDASLPA